MTTDTIRDRLESWAQEKYPNGYCIYADYRDIMSDDTILDIIESEFPRDKFIDWVYETYDEEAWYYYGELVKEARKDLDVDENEISDEALRDMLQECIDIYYPEDHFLKQEIKLDIYIDTGDADYDFVSNAMYPHYNGRKMLYEEIDSETQAASLFWLAETQGYHEWQLFEFLQSETDDNTYKKSDFLNSVYQELANTPTHMPSLVFLKQMTLGELLDILEEKKSIHIETNTMCGLYDKWSGGGGPLEIELEKPLDIPHEYIHRILPARSYRYNIDNTYGMCGWAWKGRKAS